MMSCVRLYPIAVAALLVIVSCHELLAQYNGNDTRQEYVRSSSPTKSGGRVISESVGGQKMVRIARAPAGVAAPKAAGEDREGDNDSAENASGYDYPDRSDSQQVTAFRQAANLPPQLNFPQQNRLAQCNCNGVPAAPQQLQLPQQNFAYSGFQNFPNLQLPPQPTFQQQPVFQQQPTFGAPGTYAGAGQGGYPLQAGIGVPQFNQTGGNWWTPFLSGSGYYTPLLNFRNMPQGTYLGQGIIGQPTAYVDGQPLRNLLRYVSP